MYSQASALASQYRGHGVGAAPVPAPDPQWGHMSNNGNFKQPHHNSYNDVRGTKRKRGDFHSLHRGVQQHRESSAQSRLGNTTQVAPAIPSFGFSLPAPVQETTILSDKKNTQPSTKKQKHNLLGLTPQLAGHEDDEEEEGMDEEASVMRTGAGFVAYSAYNIVDLS